MVLVGAGTIQRGYVLPSVTVGAALDGGGDAALGFRQCGLQCGYAALGSDRALGVVVWLSVGSRL